MPRFAKAYTPRRWLYLSYIHIVILFMSVPRIRSVTPSLCPIVNGELRRPCEDHIPLLPPPPHGWPIAKSLASLTPNLVGSTLFHIHTPTPVRCHSLGVYISVPRSCLPSLALVPSSLSPLHYLFPASSFPFYFTANHDGILFGLR